MVGFPSPQLPLARVILARSSHPSTHAVDKTCRQYAFVFCSRFVGKAVEPMVLMTDEPDDRRYWRNRLGGGDEGSDVGDSGRGPDVPPNVFRLTDVRNLCVPHKFVADSSMC